MDGIDAPELRSWLGQTPATTAAALAVPLPCLLCGRPASHNGVFVAKDQRRVGAPVGKVRLVRYSLCMRCRRKPGVCHRVEKRILANFDALARVN